MQNENICLQPIRWKTGAGFRGKNSMEGVAAPRHL